MACPHHATNLPKIATNCSRKQSVAVSGNNVEVSGNFVAVFGDFVASVEWTGLKATASFHAEKCCYLVSAHSASVVNRQARGW